MTDPAQLAALIRDTLSDRLDSNNAHLALEVASQRAFLFSTIDSLEHLNGHIERGELTDPAMLSASIAHLIHKITNSMANLEDVRIALAHKEPNE
jgi:hypothetical protein